MQESLNYFNGDELAANVFMSKYAIKHNNEYLEHSPEDMFLRLAETFAIVEMENSKKLTRRKKKKLSEYGQNREKLNFTRIYDYIKDFNNIIFQGSIMALAGNNYQLGSLSNCIVIEEVHDSYGGIMYADEQLAQVMKRRCGAGVDISTLRPRGDKVSNAARTSTGAVSFMERFSNTTREVAQDGRRGALMITIDVRHPDVEEFVDIKRDLSKVTGANISVKLTDDFMQAVENDADFILQFPVDTSSPEMTKKVNARELWDKIVSAARDTAEPGLIFWDKQHVYSTSSMYPGFRNISTNP